MGSSSSKAVQSASKIAASTTPKTARKYPTRSPPLSSTQRADAPKPSDPIPSTPIAHSIAPTLPLKEKGTEQDPSLPDLALNERLRQLGPITPNPTYSNSSTVHTSDPHSNPTPPNPNADPTTTAQSFQPSPTNPSQTIYPSRHANPAVSLLTARYRIAEEAEREFAETGRSSHKGRTFIDVVTLRQMLVLREQGVDEGEIERRLQLKLGVVGRLGRKGVVGVARG